MTKVDPKVSSGTTTSHVSSGPSTPVAGGHYTVKPGDTLWSLAKTVYGDSNRWREIADANPGLLRGGLNPGSKIKLPPKSPNDRMTAGDPSRDATRILDDGKPKSSGPAPQGDPRLAADLQNARTQANAGGQQTPAWLREKEPEKFIKSGGQQTLGTWESKNNIYTNRKTLNEGDGRGWHAERKNVTDEAGGQKKPEMQYSANVTVASKYGKVETSAWESEKAQGTIAGGNVAYQGQVKVLNAKAEGTASFGVDLKQGTIKGDLSGHAEANLVKLEGSLKTKPYGNQYIGGQTEVRGRAYVGAELNGNATVAFDPRHGTAKVTAGVDAFVGVKAAVEVNQSFKVGGMNVGSVGAKGEVYAGVGVKAKADVGFEKGHFKGSFEVGAALGIGAGVKINFDVNVAEPIKKVGEVAQKVGGAVADGARAVGNAVADGAKGVWNKITSLW